MIPFFFSSKSFLFVILSDSNSKDSFLLSSFCKLLIFPSMFSLLNSGSISISTSFGLSWIFGLLLSLLSFISLIISFFSLKPNIILSLGNGWYDAWYSLFIPNLTFLSLILLFSVLSSSFFSLSIPNLIFSPVNGIKGFDEISKTPNLISFSFLGFSILFLSISLFSLEDDFIGIEAPSSTPTLFSMLLLFSSSFFIFFSSSLFTPNLIFWFDNGWSCILELSFTPNLTVKLLFSSFSLILLSSFFTPNLIFSFDKGW